MTALLIGRTICMLDFISAEVSQAMTGIDTHGSPTANVLHAGNFSKSMHFSEGSYEHIAERFFKTLNWTPSTSNTTTSDPAASSPCASCPNTRT